MNNDPNVGGGGLTGEVRLRVPLPIIIPFGAILLIALATFGFSRILLSVPKEIAVVVAIVTAANVLGACTVIALRRTVNRSVLAELAIVVLYPVIIGAVLATMGLDESHAEAEPGGGPGPKPPPVASGTTVTASGTAFDTDQLTLAAKGETTIQFTNEDALPHNISVYEDDSAEAEIFVGDEVTDGEIEYPVPGPGKPGEAYFQCDFHPTMNGTVTFE
jgi:plastocyanin